jgi:hypothetical protein
LYYIRRPKQPSKLRFVRQRTFICPEYFIAVSTWELPKLDGSASNGADSPAASLPRRANPASGVKQLALISGTGQIDLKEMFVPSETEWIQFWLCAFVKIVCSTPND